VRFVLRERGIIREKKLKRVERSMKNGKRTSVNKRGKLLVLKGDLWVPVGGTSTCLCTDAVHRFFVPNCVPMVMVRAWLGGERRDSFVSQKTCCCQQWTFFFLTAYLFLFAAGQEHWHHGR
jgi:hypothetical protein